MGVGVKMMIEAFKRLRWRPTKRVSVRGRADSKHCNLLILQGEYALYLSPPYWQGGDLWRQLQEQLELEDNEISPLMAALKRLGVKKSEVGACVLVITMILGNVFMT